MQVSQDNMEPSTEILALLFFALGGVGAIGALLYATGTLKDAVIESVAQIQGQIREELPDFQTSEITISADSRTSIAVDKTGTSIALIYCLGDKLVVREFDARTLIGCRLRGEPGKTPLILEIDVSDFARPRFDIVLDMPANLAVIHHGNAVDKDEMGSPHMAEDIGKFWTHKVSEIIGSAAIPPLESTTSSG